MTSDIRLRILLIRWLAAPLALLAIALPGKAAANDDNDGGAVKFSPKAELTFKQRCSACHTYGKGVKVGPDLKGVNDRRKHEWLLKFIHQSSAVIKSGDPIATALFAQFKQQRMPDWTDLSEQDITDILYYISIGGPDIKPPDERLASTATAAELEAGKKLFYGETRFKYGAQGCVTCHRVQSGGMRGGTMGPELSSVYTRYRDVALTSFLRHPCSEWDTGSSDHYMTTHESFAIKAFLYQESLAGSAPGMAKGNQ
ncbi:MAG TPA: c-type cytochrome [Candidatus Saccharimonadales bacterium]|nr:c-type cytochrome [Candidatus Saccharimonadales bacterium]